MRPRSYTVPLVALGSTLFFLVAAIVVVVAARAGAGAGADEEPPCLVGTWNVLRHVEDVPLPPAAGGGTVTLQGGRGATLVLRADGTGVADYGTRTEYLGQIGEQVIKLEVSGRVTFRYTTDGSTARLSDIDVQAQGQAYVDGVKQGEPDELEPTDVSTYECADDRMTEKSGAATITYERAP
jgi:hypothetical protein